MSKAMGASCSRSAHHRPESFLPLALSGLQDSGVAPEGRDSTMMQKLLFRAGNSWSPESPLMNLES